MITVDQRQVQLGSTPATKDAAIRAVGQLLVSAGNIESGYVESMLGRENQANTYLGNGIAIPHGQPQHRDLIKQTGIAVLQVPAGVEWNNGEAARLIVGIAARSDEHIEVLRRLTRVLGDQALVAKLASTTDAADIIQALTGERPAAPQETPADFAQYFDATVENATGLHARPATAFADLARQFASAIRVRYRNDVADGKSLLSLLQLGIERGAQIRVSAEGADAATALRTLQTALADKLGEEEEHHAPPADHGWVPQSVGATLIGASAAEGLAVGPVRQHARSLLVVEDVAGSDTDAEGDKLQSALNNAKTDLDKLFEEVKTRLGSNRASIFRAHAALLDDPDMIQQVVRHIFDGHNAAWSWQQVVNGRVAQMQKLDDPVLAGRAVDLSDVGQRVLRHLAGVPDAAPLAPDTPVVLVADDLTPSDTASLDPDTILGFCTASGGPTSHSAIIARSMGIPAVVAAGKAVIDIPDGTPCVLDGSGGRLYLRPSAADVEEANAAQQRLRQAREMAEASRHQAAVTSDGRHVEVAANVNRVDDARKAVAAGADGVGLMRTEFLYLERNSVPSEDEQYEVYRGMVEALAGRPLVIRTLDIGGDKEVPYLNLPKEDNSFLGIRGIRLCLARPDLFVPQLRALYRAAAHGPIHIMFPMIATLEDLEAARAMAEQVRAELDAPAVPIGIMIEVPSAALMADQFAEVVDFFSIGTNDLTQYALAMDRLHPQLARQADGLHPAVLRLIDRTVQAAAAHGKWVGVCGGLAGDPKGAAILAGLGVAELSVGTPSVPIVKNAIRNASFADLQAMAKRALQCRNGSEVRAL